MTGARREPVAPIEYVSIAEAAAIYHVSRDYIRNQIIAGALPAIRSGRRIIRISTADLERMFRPVQSLRSILQV